MATATSDALGLDSKKSKALKGRNKRDGSFVSPLQGFLKCLELLTQAGAALGLG